MGDIAWTTVTSIVVLAANFILSGMLARRGAVDVYEPYNIAKRIGAAAMPFLSLGLGVGVVKMIAAARDSKTRSAYTLSASVLVFVMLAVTALVAFFFPEAVSRLLLGEENTLLLAAVFAYSASLAVNALVYALYRAEIRQSAANWTSLIAVAFVPLAVLGLAPSSWSVHNLLFTVSGLILLWNGGQLLWRITSAIPKVNRSALVSSGKELLHYSLPRVPSGVAGGTLLVLPALFARQAGNLTASSYLLAGLSVVQLAGASVQAFGIVLLPRVSYLHATDRGEDLRSFAWRLMFGALVFAAFAAPSAMGIVQTLVPLWLGPEFVDAMPVIMLTIVAIPGVVLFNILRSIADGTIRAPVNTYAAVTGLAVAAVGMAFASGNAMLLALWYVLGQAIISGIVAVTLVRHLQIQIRFGYPALALAAGVAFGLLASLAGTLIGDGVVPGVLLLTVEVIVGLVALLALAWWFPETYGLRSTARRSIVRILPARMRPS